MHASENCCPPLKLSPVKLSTTYLATLKSTLLSSSDHSKIETIEEWKLQLTNWGRKIRIEKIEGKLKLSTVNCQRKFEMHLLWSFKSTNWSFKGLSGTINLLSVQFPIFSWLDFQDWKFLWRVYSRALRKIANQNRKGVRRRDEDAIIGGGPLEGPKGS